MELKKLMEHISIIPDYRQAWKVEHKLSDSFSDKRRVVFRCVVSLPDFMWIECIRTNLTSNRNSDYRVF